MSRRFVCGDKEIDLSQPAVMGILNVTPDSFSDGGVFLDPTAALHRADRMVEEGASVIDVGGESTRPGAAPVDSAEEIRRVVPVIAALAPRLPVPVSVDTSKPEVMRAAVDAGATMINDVRALRWPGALECAAALKVPVCLMHMQGEPTTMQARPHYESVDREVGDFLVGRLAASIEAGIPRDRLWVDPGFGFGKTVEHNLSLLRHLRSLGARCAAPVLVGLSRKGLLGSLLGLDVGERLSASVVLATMAWYEGADMVRVHDVAATVHAARLYRAVYGARNGL